MYPIANYTWIVSWEGGSKVVIDAYDFGSSALYLFNKSWRSHRWL